MRSTFPSLTSSHETSRYVDAAPPKDPHEIDFRVHEESMLKPEVGGVRGGL
jgi:hypothetical protein